VSRSGAQVVAIASLALVLADVASPDRGVVANVLLGIAERLCAAILFSDAVLRFYLAPKKLKHLGSEWYDLAVVSLSVASLIDTHYFRALTLASLGIVMAKRVLTPRGGESFAEDLLRHPARLVALTFAATIIAGVVLLSLPAATTDGNGLPILDALFTATSATCVTGLAVNDISTALTPLGQTVIALLIQVGGLGIMTLSTAIALFLGRRVSVSGQMAASQPIASRQLAPNLQRMLRVVVLITVAVEVVGMLLLWPAFYERSGGDLLASLGKAAFHSISAFCNAGFSLQTDSLESFRHSGMINLVVPTLIVLGGLGFVVFSDILGNGLPRRRRRWGWRALQVHTRLVLVVSAVLILIGTAYIFFGEFDGVLSGLPLGEKLSSSFFLSVSSRTAGFNSLPTGRLADATLFVVILLMFVGGSPGSTAGGIKTTTLAILLFTIRTMTRGRQETEAFGRTIPRATVYTALTVTLLSLLLVVGATTILALTEDKGFIQVLFESVSAFATVGLSTGMTPELSDAGKVLITILMFVGRTGPLTLALALARRAQPSPVAYPEAEIQVG